MILKTSGRKYKIQVLDKIDNEDNWGNINVENNTIKLKKLKNIEETKRTLLHECFHAFFHELGFNSIKNFEDELLCDGLGNQLYNFIDNTMGINRLFCKVIILILTVLYD